MTFCSAFSWMKMFEFQLKFHWSLFLRVQLTIFQHWFRYWIGAVQATSHYLNQWWSDYWRIYASLGLNGLNKNHCLLIHVLLQFDSNGAAAKSFKFRNHQEPWWRHQMETFSALLALCEGNSPVSGEFTPQRPVTRSFDLFFYLRLNKQLNKQSRGWWFETPSRSFWRHCNDPHESGCQNCRHILDNHGCQTGLKNTKF